MSTAHEPHQEPKQDRMDRHSDTKHEQKIYLTFAAMISTSTVTMFLLTYTNAWTWAHMTFSEERVYMAILMGSVMAVIMLAFMWGKMYRNVTVNLAIVAGAVVLGLTALWLSRSQTFVEDQAYMNGMIPHHSIAILTSERADLDDVRVRELADAIIETQREEIAEMKWLVDDIEQNGVVTTQEQAQERPVPDLGVAP